MNIEVRVDVVVKKFTFTISSPDEFLVGHTASFLDFYSTLVPHVSTSAATTADFV